MVGAESITLLPVCIVSEANIASSKGFLASHDLLHPQHKIKPWIDGEPGVEQRFAIPLRRALTDADHGQAHLGNHAQLDIQYVSASLFMSKTRKKQLTPADSIRAAFDTFVTSTSPLGAPIETLNKELPQSFTVYGTLLLLPPKSFSAEPWPTTMKSFPTAWNDFMSALAVAARVTHMAVNAPIPLARERETASVIESGDASAPTSSLQPGLANQSSILAPPASTTLPCKNHPRVEAEENSHSWNALRSPSQLLPLYGDFGPAPDSTNTVPSDLDYFAAYWTSTVQNGITQVWAPQYTMFSAGNLREKTRLLSLPSVTNTVQLSKLDGTGCSVVDLYIGIGYFAFSYLRAGVSFVLGWDLNPWSLEGLRRGAEANKWEVHVRLPTPAASSESKAKDVADVLDHFEHAGERRPHLIALCEDNIYAAASVESIRPRIPPVRHVNCGLLPSSAGSWTTAIQVLDRRHGGWIHIHENFALAEIAERAAAIRDNIETQVARVAGWPAPTKVTLEQVFRVKSYAPGVYHCVVDVHIDPGPSLE